MALETNDSGKISSDMPWAAWTFPAMSMVTNIHMKANPNASTRAKAASASMLKPWG